jgi:hypothetical protein
VLALLDRDWAPVINSFLNPRGPSENKIVARARAVPAVFLGVNPVRRFARAVAPYVVNLALYRVRFDLGQFVGAHS